VNVQQTADSHLLARRMAICVAASLVLIVLSLTFAGLDLGAVLCFGDPHLPLTSGWYLEA
jgi:hypothetical protein